MSDAGSTTTAPATTPRLVQVSIGVLVLMVLALAVGAGFLSNNVEAAQRELKTIREQLDQERSAATSRATAIDKAFAPLVLNQAKSAEALLKKGDKAAAQAQLGQAQTAALALRQLGSGSPPGQLIASLTAVEKAFGQPPTLLPAQLGGT